MGWSAEATFFLLAAAVQAVLGVAIIVRRARVEWALVLGAIFLGNAATQVNSLLVTLVPSWAASTADTAVFYDLDRTVTLLIAYLALAYPRRPRWARSPVVLPALFTLLLASVLVPKWIGIDYYVSIPESMAPPGCGDDCLRGTGIQYWSYQVTNFGFVLLIVRWAYLLPRVQSPVELQHLRLLFAAFACRALHIELLIYKFSPFDQLFEVNPFFAADPWLWVYYVRAGVTQLGITAAVVLLLLARRNQTSDRRRAIDFVLVFMLIGAIESFIFRPYPIFGFGGDHGEYYFSALLHLDVLVLRPVLVVYAMLRYDFLGAWTGGRKSVIIATAALATIAYAAGVQPSVDVITDAPAATWALTLGIALVLGVLTAVVLQAYVAPPRASGAARYLALLEDLYRNGRPGPARIEALRRDRERLGVDEAQGEALRAAVASRWQGDGAGDWLPGQRIAGRYELLRLLGSGGWGETYLAHDDVDSRDVVLKRTKALTSVERKALLAEAYLLTKLSHPNLVPLVRTEVVDGEPVLVLEHMAGGSLAGRLNEGRLTRTEVQAVADGLLGALVAVHGAGIVHGDVKPGNVLLDGDGRVRLGDFGLAHQDRRARTALGDPTPSPRALGTGTVRYLAPEQARGQPATAASDVYAAGIVLLECLTGRHPIDAGQPEYEQRRAVAEDEVELPTSLGPWRGVIARMLERDPARRPTAGRVRENLPATAETAR